MLSGDDKLFLADDTEIAELSVLLPGEQALSLEQAAHERGLTTAQMLRRLIQDFLRGSRVGQDAEPRFARPWA
jgi:hypothetical protein